MLYTHPHADHLHGIDDLRSLNFLMQQRIPCYGNEWTISTIRQKFSYIFELTQLGGGKPGIDLQVLAGPESIAGVLVTPLEVIHGKLPVLGFRINNAAYLTDCNFIPESTLEKMRGLDVLVLDCLRFTPHPTHFNVEESLQMAQRIGAKRTFFTHMGHEIDYTRFAKSLPKTMRPAYDGLVIKV